MTSPIPLAALRRQIQTEQPLIHCITNHISIRDCANGLLALGARPIMAEHPAEVAEIVVTAQALMANLGNISDSRMAAITNAAQAAKDRGIPCVLDAVGVGCSTLRREFAQTFLAQTPPSVLKGNASELRALCGLPHHAKGIDSGEPDDREESIATAQQTARRFGTVVLLSGAVDVVTDGVRTCALSGGHPLMAQVTGTGCLQGAVVGAFLAVTDPFTAAQAGAALLGLAGEASAADFSTHRSLSRFAAGLIDGLYALDDAALAAVES